MSTKQSIALVSTDSLNDSVHFYRDCFTDQFFIEIEQNGESKTTEITNEELIQELGEAFKPKYTNEYDYKENFYLKELQEWLEEQIRKNVNAILCYSTAGFSTTVRGANDGDCFMLRQWNKAYSSVLKQIGEME